MNIKYIIRWILVLPGALGVFLAVILLLTAFTAKDNRHPGMITWLNFWSFLPLWVSSIVFGTIASFCAVFVGSLIAPSKRFVVSIVLTALLGLALLFVTIYPITNINYQVSAEDPLFAQVTEIILFTAAMVFACILINKIDRDKSKEI